MHKVVNKYYNWNPYHGRTTKSNANMQLDKLPSIPPEYKQGGWGMQPQSRTNCPDVYKLFPNTDILHNLMWDGQRVDEMAHLLYNPLRELGHRQPSIADGRDYNVLERVLAPYNENIVEEWHGLQPIQDQMQNGTQNMTDFNCNESIEKLQKMNENEINLQLEIFDISIKGTLKEKIAILTTKLREQESNEYKERDMKRMESLNKHRISSDVKLHSLTKKQLLMRTLKKKAEESFEQRLSLPPFKYGYEDVPVLVRQRNFHAPDYLGDVKRTRELKADMSIFMKHVFPDMTKEQSIACALIAGRQYNRETTELRLICTDNYCYSENETKIIQWISKIILEIERLSICIDPQTEKINCSTWEEYKDKHENEWKEEQIKLRWHKYRWTQEMLSMPEHLRSNANLYQSGPRMKKISTYLDVMYDKAFIDAAHILQREGPKKHNALQFSQPYVPYFYEKTVKNSNSLPMNKYGYNFENSMNRFFKRTYDPQLHSQRFIERLDELPIEPRDYILNRNDFKSDNEVIHKFSKIDFSNDKKRNAINFNYNDSEYATFGLRSSYQIPSSQVNEYLGEWNVPLAQPFSGLRLRKKKLTPWTNGHLMQYYRSKYHKRLALKLVFGNPLSKKSVAEEIKLKEEKIKSEELKKVQKQLNQGPKRKRKKAAVKIAKIEQKMVRRKKINDKFNQKPERNPFFISMKSAQNIVIKKRTDPKIKDISE